jgi:N-acyl-D-aspartate/D-glutamate deacylase
LLAPANAESS